MNPSQSGEVKQIVGGTLKARGRFTTSLRAQESQEESLVTNFEASQCLPKLSLCLVLRPSSFFAELYQKDGLGEALEKVKVWRQVVAMLLCWDPHLRTKQRRAKNQTLALHGRHSKP